MNEPIRVLHFADIHVGMENHGRTDPETGLSSRVRDFLRRLDEMIEYAAKQEVDLVIFAGDAFKTRTPNPTYQREFAHRIRDLSDLAPTVLLVGNHDLPPTRLKASSIEIYETLRVPNVLVAAEYDVHTVETKRGPVAVGTAPYPVRSRLLEDQGLAGLTIADTDRALQEAVVRVLAELADRVDDLEMPRLLTGHFTIGGAVLGSERHIMLGRDVAAPLSAVADPRWDYVAMGHIHKHQDLTRDKRGMPPVVYSGSMERIDFGEQGDEKGFCWVELARGATTWRFVPLPARPFVTLEADLREAANPTDALLHLIRQYDLREAILRLDVQLTPEAESRFSEGVVREALRQAGAYQVAATRRRIEQPLRARLGMQPEMMTPEELLVRYLQSKEETPERRERLIELAQTIFGGESEE